MLCCVVVVVVIKLRDVKMLLWPVVAHVHCAGGGGGSKSVQRASCWLGPTWLTQRAHFLRRGGESELVHGILIFVLRTSVRSHMTSPLQVYGPWSRMSCTMIEHTL